MITAFSVIAISIGAIQKITYLMVYLYVYGISFKKLKAYFNKMADDSEEQEELRLILPEEEEPVASLEEDEEVEYIYDFEGTGEQLRRLRAYNPILSDETEDDYKNRIWNMAYKEDEEEAQKASSEAEEKDVTVWYKFDDGKERYKGEWRNGLPNGNGIKHIYKDDSYIYGNFVDGYAEGHCKQTFEQTWEKMEPYYEGEFKKNEYHGKGEYHYGNQDYYKGDWKDSKYHGQGAEYSKRLNKTWVGEFDNDEKIDGNWVKGEI